MILVFVEHDGRSPAPWSLEALSFAARLADELAVQVEAIIVAADGERGVAASLDADRVAAVHVVEGPGCSPYAPAAWGRAVAGLAARRQAPIVLASAAGRGQEVLAFAAALANRPLATGCLEVHSARPGGMHPAQREAPPPELLPAELLPAALLLTRQRWGGTVLEEARLAGAPAFLTVAEHAVQPLPAGYAATAPVTTWPANELGVTEADLRVRLLEREGRQPGTVALSDARVVVGGGRGVGGPEAFALLEELAGLLGGAVGVSRVVTSAGWRPHTEQIGQTGTRIAPDLYIACGISGAIQHIVGCRSAKAILAINTDPDAPIMSRATHAVIGDLHAVVPAIIAELRRTAPPGG